MSSPKYKYQMQVEQLYAKCFYFSSLTFQLTAQQDIHFQNNTAIAVKLMFLNYEYSITIQDNQV